MVTMTAHFVGSGRFQAVSASREHAFHAPDVRPDIRFGPWRRCSHLCSHLPGSRGRSYSTCQRRHVRDQMSDRTSGAWSTCSLDALTAWKRPEPTKWTVVVIFCARATNHENEVFSAKIAISSPCAIFDHDGPFRRLGACPGCQPM